MKLLLALDLGPRHEALFDVAVKWATRMNAQVDILYVLPFAPLPALRDPALQAALDAELRSDTVQRKRISQLLLRLPVDLRGSIHTRNGNPADEVLELARDFDALLLGTNGRTGLGRLWMGSVAEKVVRLSSIPVVVLPLSGIDG